MMKPYHLPVTLGGMIGEGARKLLGAPDLGVFELVVRECAQNTWDARLDGAQPSFRFSVERLNQNAQYTLTTDVFGIDDEVSRDLRAWAREGNDSWVIEIDDRNTSGLDGLTDPQRTPLPGENTNFRDLVYIYGATRDTEFGGGTYGFGKTASYLASDFNTVIYWTRCEHAGGFEYRLIASRMGDNFDSGGIAYTGRSWWGDPSESGKCAPIVGEDARRIGEQLFSRQFDGDETGTSIMILKPVQHVEADGVEDTDEGLAMKRIAKVARDAVLRNLWPKLTPYQEGGRRPMEIIVHCDGEDLPLGDSSRGLWRSWAAALNSARTGDVNGPIESRLFHFPIGYQRAQKNLDGLKDLGSLSFAFGMAMAVQDPFDELFASMGGKLCRMRSAELVVDYVDVKDVASLPFGTLVGVFRVLPEHRADEVFAKAESPSHNSWQAEILDLDHRRPFNYAITSIGAKSQVVIDELVGKDNDPERRLSDAIGQQLKHLRPYAQAQPSEAPQSKKSRGRRRKVEKPTILSIEFEGTDERGNQVQNVTIRTPEVEGSFPCLVSVERQGDDKAYPFDPGVLQFSWSGDEQVDGAASSDVILRGNTLYNVRVSCPSDYALNFELVGAMA